MTRRFPSRRALLTTAALAVPAAVIGCTSLTTSTVASDVQTLATGLGAIVSDLQAAGVSVAAGTVTAIQNEISAINANASQIAATVTSTSVVSAFQNGLSTLGTLLAPFFPAAPLIATVVQAAVTLGTTILSEAGVSITGAAPRGMTAQKARAILLAAAA